MHGARARRWPIALALVGSFAAFNARAADDPKQRASAAETLFDDAKALMARGDAAAACPKFEKSQELDPGAGTQFFLADCYEATGHLAHALALFRDLEGVLVRVADPRAKLAAERAAKLEARVPKLSVRVPWADRARGLVVLRDEHALEVLDLGQPTSVDVGTHVLEVRAEGRRAWHAQVNLSEGQRLVVDVPDLVVDTPLPPPARPSRQRTLALVTGGVGVAALAGGAILIAVEKGRYDSAVVGCPTSGDAYVCDPASGAKVRGDGATALANVGAVIGALGAAAVVTGVVLWLTAPREDRPQAPRAYVAPSLGAVGGVVVGGVF